MHHLIVVVFICLCEFFPYKISFSKLTTIVLFSRRPQYQPLSLKRLQYLVDLGRVDPTQPIDLTQLVNARGVTVQPLKRDYGVQLVDEVGVRFKASYQNFYH